MAGTAGAAALASRFWNTTASYFRGQIVVALVDAGFIGIGLLLLGILGAFLAVPITASLARAVDYLRHQTGADASQSGSQVAG